MALGATRNEDVLITLGIQPSRPDTGYGYIQYIPDKLTVKKVKSFTEKPHLELALQFLDSGDFVWNAGIFVWNVNAFKKALIEFQPEIAEILKEASRIITLTAKMLSFNGPISIAEVFRLTMRSWKRRDNVHVVLSNFGWSDLGTWKSLYEVSDKDSDMNVTDGNLLLYNTTNSIIKTPKDKLVVISGLDGYIVAEYDGVCADMQKR